MRRDDAIARLRQVEHELRRRGVQRLAVFGSTARGLASAESDVDLLVDLDPTRQLSLVDYADLRLFLADVLSCEVDVVERQCIKPKMRDEVLGSAVDILQ